MTEKVDIAVLNNDIKYIKKAVERIEDNSVSKARFKPVELIAYGTAGLFLTAVGIALVAQVVVAFN